MSGCPNIQCLWYIHHLQKFLLILFYFLLFVCVCVIRIVKIYHLGKFLSI